MLMVSESLVFDVFCLAGSLRRHLNIEEGGAGGDGDLLGFYEDLSPVSW